VIYESAFGKRELGKDAPMTLDTVAWIASMTKAITATAAMQLVELGKLDLERPASETVPAIASPKCSRASTPRASRDSRRPSDRSRSAIC
jgi:methyl acetate hydrolase